MAMDSTMKSMLLVLGAIVSFVFTILTLAFGTDIALYSMAVKNDIFWESEYGYTDWNSTTETGTTKSVYHTNADTVETTSMDAIMDAVDVVTIAGALITLILLALIFFRKDGGLVHMFKGASQGN